MVPGVFLHIAVFLVVGLCVSEGQSGLNDDPCDTHATLTGTWRHPDAEADPNHCDTMAEGWYTFLLDGKEKAKIPTQCMQDNTCGAQISLHLELGADQQEPEVGQNVTAFLCGSFNVLGSIDCCVQRQPVTIKRCADDLFVYYLKPQIVCPVAFCAIRVTDAVIPERYLAKRGDRPRSLPPQVTAEASDATDSETATSSSSSKGPTTHPEITRMLQPIDVSSSTSTTASMGLATASAGPATASTRPATASAGPATASAGPATASLNGSDNSTTSFSPGIFSSDSIDQENSTVAQLPPIPDNNTENGTSAGSLPSTSSAASTAEAEATNATAVTVDGHLGGVVTTENSTVTENVTDTDPASPVDAATAEMPKSSQPLETTPDSVSPTGTVATSRSTTVRTSPPRNPSAATTATTTTTATVTTTSSGTAASSSYVANTGNSTRPSGGRESSAVSSGPGSESPRSTVEPAAGSSDPEAVRFVLRGAYEDSMFRATLLAFVNRFSHWLTGSHGDIHDVNVTDVTSHDNVTVVDVYVTSPATNETIPADLLIEIVENNTFTEQLLSEAGLELEAVCRSEQQCDRVQQHVRQHQPSLFTQNRPLFIAVIVVAALCLLLLILGLLYVRCRRQGTWVLAADHEEKGPEALAFESPMTDSQIVQGEAAVTATALTANGDRPHTPDDIPAADEDNGWVVPLDQAPPAADGMASKTEDTQF